ncbi:MAG: hypothetical protein EBS86_16535, partial [Crocinitomicaceae bacterium]|nr:hypothetical protein [Crocinitomicaceae bacterium]
WEDKRYKIWIMTVKFNHPTINGNNPLEDFNPNEISHYPNVPGIYIYGFRKEIDGKKVFIPLYVGIAKNLKDRLFQHFNEEKSSGNSKWYIFDYASLNYSKDIKDLYVDMSIADSQRGIKLSRYSNKLIWFNHSSFFDFKLNVDNSKYVSNSGVQMSINHNGDLDKIEIRNPLAGAALLKNQIIQAKRIFDKDFYFVFAGLNEHIEINEGDELFDLYSSFLKTGLYMNGRKNGPGRSICEKIEHFTKVKLSQLGIYTAAKSHGKLVHGYLDLSAIQNELILLNNEAFNNCEYKTPLIF